MKTKELEERLKKLEEVLLKTGVEFGSSDTNTEFKKEKTKRAPSAYNIFMKDELARLKKEQGADFDRKTAFKTIANSWNEKKNKGSDKSDGWFG